MNSEIGKQFDAPWAAAKPHLIRVLKQFEGATYDYKGAWYRSPLQIADNIAEESLNSVANMGNPSITADIQRESLRVNALRLRDLGMGVRTEIDNQILFGEDKNVRGLAVRIANNEIMPTANIFRLTQGSPLDLFMKCSQDPVITSEATWELDSYNLARVIWGDYHAAVYKQLFDYARMNHLLIERENPEISMEEAWRQRLAEIEVRYHVPHVEPDKFTSWEDYYGNLLSGLVGKDYEKLEYGDSVLEVFGGTEAAGREQEGLWKGDEDGIWLGQLGQHVALVGLADGMGGEGLDGFIKVRGDSVKVGGGVFASQYVLRVAKKYFANFMQSGVNPREAMQATAEIIDCLIDYTPEDIVPNKAGATLMLTYYDMENDQGYLLNIGDGRAKILDKKGREKQILTYAQEAEGTGVLLNGISKDPQSRVIVDPSQLVQKVGNYLPNGGQGAFLISEFKLEKGDRLVMACDGLDKATDRELADLNRKGLSKQLKDQGQRTYDNASVLIMDRK